jgi:hypothetical protein
MRRWRTHNVAVAWLWRSIQNSEAAQPTLVGVSESLRGLLVGNDTNRASNGSSRKLDRTILSLSLRNGIGRVTVDSSLNGLGPMCPVKGGLGVCREVLGAGCNGGFSFGAVADSAGNLGRPAPP